MSNMQKGHIISYVAQKKFGFIKGIDGEDYFFHLSFLEDKCHERYIAKGATVTFDPTPSPKGLTAKSLYIQPVIRGKQLTPFKTYRSLPNKLSVEHTIDVITAFSRNPNDKRDDLECMAYEVGANAIVNVQHEKRTFSQGNYRFSKHAFSATLAVVTEEVTFSCEAEKDAAQNKLDSALDAISRSGEQVIAKELGSRQSQLTFEFGKSMGGLLLVLFIIYYLYSHT